MELGIIGKARSGKTSLFNAVTRGTAQVGAYSAGNQPNVGMVHVPDARVDALSEVYKTKKTTYAESRWVDFPVAGFSNEGPGAQFVADLAKMDAVVHVVRAFEDASVPHPDETIDAHRDVEALNLELTQSEVHRAQCHDRNQRGQPNPFQQRPGHGRHDGVHHTDQPERSAAG